MKKMFTLAMMMVMTISANAMSYKNAKNEALFLSDKMAYELKLTNAQYDAVYEINLDYLMSVNGRNDANGYWWKRRNTDLKYVLTAYQYEKYVKLNYFYRPITWVNNGWRINVYSHYSKKDYFYNGRPNGYANYKGGHNKGDNRYYADRYGNNHTSASTWRNTTGNSNVTAHNSGYNHVTSHNSSNNHNSSGSFSNHH